MALQTSGAISLNEIHVEAGGSSGTLVGINDSDVRGLTGASSGASSSFNSFYGTSSAWTRTLTVGHAGSGPGIPGNATGLIGHYWDNNGGQQYTVDGGRGSLSPNNLFDNGATILNLMFYIRVPIKGAQSWEFAFRLVGNHANSGWNNMVMDDGKGGTISVSRTQCTYTYYSSQGGLYNIPNNTTEWRYTYNFGTVWDNGAASTRASYYRTGYSVLIAGHTGIANPSLTWTLNKQINVTIN